MLRQITEASLGFRGLQSVAFTPQGSRNSNPGGAACEWDPDSELASCLQAVPAPWWATAVPPCLSKGGVGAQRGRETAVFLGA